jgi:hypothetical protein
MSLEYNSVSGSASVTLELGQGDDEAILEANYFLDALHLQIDGGAGSDVLVCEDDWLSGLTDYKISLDDGDDTATFEGNVYDQGLTMFLDAGDGRDTVSFHGNSLAAVPSMSELAGALNAYIDLDNGDDKAMFALNAYTGSVLMTVLGGDGKDLVTIQDDSIAAIQDDSIAAVFDVLVDLGHGDDTAMFALNAYTGSLFMTVLGGDGKDLVTILCNGLGPVSVLVDLGDGRDTANVNLTLVNQDPAQDQPITVRVLGGKGDDDLTLTVKADPTALAAGTLLIDGGSGFDHGVGGPFVKISDCEQ